MSSHVILQSRSEGGNLRVLWGVEQNLRKFHPWISTFCKLRKDRHYFQWWNSNVLEEYILGDLEAVTEAVHQNS